MADHHDHGHQHGEEDVEFNKAKVEEYEMEMEDVVKLFSANTLRELRSLPWWKKGLSVLDFGCGNGINSIVLADEEECTVLACDVSQAMLDKLEGRVQTLKTNGEEGGAATASRITVKKLHGATNDFPGQYDVILCSLCFHHAAAHLPAILANLKKFIAPGGRLVVTEFERTEETHKIRAAEQSRGDNHGHSHDHGHDHGSCAHNPQEVCWLEADGIVKLVKAGDDGDDFEQEDVKKSQVIAALRGTPMTPWCFWHLIVRRKQ